MSPEVCLCGHPADDHSMLGFCDIDGYECESYRPSDDEDEAVA